MTREQEIAKIQKDSNFCWNLRKKLLLQGLPLDNEAVQHLDERIWDLMFRLYALTAGEAAGARLLSQLGIHQN